MERPVAAPLLETKRLTLRAHCVADYDELCKIWAEPEVYRFTIGHAATPGESWHRLMRYGGFWPLLGYGFWAVEIKSTGEYIGDVGLTDFHRDITPSLHGMPELGWILKTSAHGKGYATEAMHAVDAWSRQHLNAETLCCIITPSNARSVNVAEKLGFEPQVTVPYEGNDVTVFTRARVPILKEIH